MTEQAEHTILTGDEVERIFIDCLFRDDEDMTEMVKVEGVVDTAGFHPGRLESHRADVAAMLAELPDTFLQSKGGGMSLLNACEDRYGNLWTGFQMRVGQLFQLAMGLGLAEFVFPRSLWAVLPGSVPYYVVLDAPTMVLKDHE